MSLYKVYTSKAVKTVLIMVCMVLGLSAHAEAGPVEVEILKGQAIVGENLSFAIKFSLENDKDAIDVSNVQFEGTALPYEVRSQTSSSFSMIVNGKTVRSSSDIVKTYIFQVPTRKVGPLVVPEFSVSLGGENYRVKSLSFQVTERPSSNDLRFLVTVNNPQSQYYPSQVIDLKCQVLFRNFPGRPEIADISLPIMKDMSFELLPVDNPNFELIINGDRIAVNAQQRRTKLSGNTYNTLEFNLKFRLMNSGDFTFDNYTKMIVETGKTYRQRSLFFGSELVRETKPLFADSQPLKISVLELPSEDVPTSFNGAIGRFKIKVTPSSDTAIRVGDPITLLIEISGRGTWEFVKSPPIHHESKITDYFIVSQEPVVGEVNESQSMKSFSVRLRVKSKTVKEIPAIPFTYFDLSLRKYVTVYSEPVPIRVFDSAATAKIIDFNDQTPDAANEEDVSLQNTKGQQEADSTVSMGSTSKNDLPEPALPPLVEIADNVPLSETTANHAPNYGYLLYAVLPLAGVFALFVFRLYRKRDVSEEMQAMQKSKKAYVKFQKTVNNLDTSGGDVQAFCRSLGQCVQQYLEDRFICKLSLIDEQSMKVFVDQGKMKNADARALVKIIEEIDQYRYSSNTADAAQMDKLAKDTIEAIEKCDM